MYTQVPSSDEFLTNYVAILWVEFGQPYSKHFDLLSEQISTRYSKSFDLIQVVTVADKVFSLIRLRVSPVFSKGMPCPCRANAVPLPCRVAKGLECVFPIWFTQCGRFWFTLAMPCSDYAILLKATTQHGRRETAVLCCGLEKNGIVGAWHGKCESDTAALCKSNGKDTFLFNFCVSMHHYIWVY